MLPSLDIVDLARVRGAMTLREARNLRNLKDPKTMVCELLMTKPPHMVESKDLGKWYEYNCSERIGRSGSVGSDAVSPL